DLLLDAPVWPPQSAAGRQRGTDRHAHLDGGRRSRKVCDRRRPELSGVRVAVPGHLHLQSHRPVDNAGGSTAHVVQRTRVILAASLACGLALRLLHLFALRGDILFDHPQLDEEIYVDAGRTLAAGQVFEPKPYWQPPGLMVALMAIFRFAGRGLLAPRIV